MPPLTCVCEKHFPEQINGAQCHNGVWSIISKIGNARSDMVNNLKVVNINNTEIEIYDKYPIGKEIR